LGAPAVADAGGDVNCGHGAPASNSLTGGNGGVLRDLQLSVEAIPPLDAAGRRRCRDALESVGVTLTDLPDEAFVVGSAAYARGARLKDGAVIPQYWF
jgi:hypothetical protein